MAIVLKTCQQLVGPLLSSKIGCNESAVNFEAYIGTKSVRDTWKHSLPRSDGVRAKLVKNTKR